MFIENSEERRAREMREIEAMMEQARFRAAIQRLNEQRTGQNSSSGGVGGGKKPELPLPPVPPPEPTASSDWVIYLSDGIGGPSLLAHNLVTEDEFILGSIPNMPGGIMGMTAREKPGMPGTMEIAVAEYGTTGADPVTLYRTEVPSIIASPIIWDSGTILTPTPTPVGTMSARSLAYAGDSLYFLYSNKFAAEVRLGKVNFNSNIIDISMVITGWTLPGTLGFLGESTSTEILLGSYVQGGFMTPALHYWQAYNPDTSTYTPVYSDLVGPTSELIPKLSRRPGPSGEHLGIYPGTFVGTPWLIDSLGINVVPQPSPLGAQIESSFFTWSPSSWVPVVV